MLRRVIARRMYSSLSGIAPSASEDRLHSEFELHRGNVDRVRLVRPGIFLSGSDLDPLRSILASARAWLRVILSGIETPFGAVQR